MESAAERENRGARVRCGLGSLLVGGQLAEGSGRTWERLLCFRRAWGDDEGRGKETGRGREKQVGSAREVGCQAVLVLALFFSIFLFPFAFFL